MKNIICIICLLLMGTFSLSAQINIGGEPLSYKQSLEKSFQVVDMPAIDMDKIKIQDEKDEADGRPPRFGFPHEANLNIETNGTWQTLPNNEGRIWRLGIHCPSAVSINLLYDKFWLPKGATLYIYNKDKKHLIGGFTSDNNNSPRGESIGYATGIVYGDEIVLEYYEPHTVKETAELSIARVVHGYRTINLGLEKAYGDSGNCQININCPDGANHQGAKTSVALILVDGTRWCTGSLINTTIGDFQPYLLTANHCLNGWAIPTALDASTNPFASTWSFYWNYETPSCTNPATEPSGWTSTTGAYVVANKSDSDFALLHLTEDPYRDAGLVASYNGWDAGNAPPAGGAGIHHPNGDVKKISLYTQVPTSDHACAPSNTWSVIFQHPSGVFTTTEPGSSGSPLYDANGRVIGQLWGGANPIDCTGGPTCSNPSQDMSYYGKLGVSWDDAGGPMRRLKDWLSPTCHVNYTVSSDITQGVSHQYADQVMTSNRVVSGSNTVATLNGGEAVHLTEGFRASGGAVFRATNTDCDNTTFTGDTDQSRQSFDLPTGGSMVVPLGGGKSKVIYTN